MNTTEILSSFPQSIILDIDSEHRVKEAYGEQVASLQTSSRSLTDRPILDIFTPAIYTKIKALIDEEMTSLSITFKDKDFDVYYKSSVDQDGGYLYFVDVTHHNKEELQAVFDMAANGISILDHDGMFLYANQFFQDLMGYTMEELYTESCISLSSPEYALASETAVEKAIKYGSIQNFRKVCVTKSGEHLNASMSLSYLKSRDEIVMITSDITQDIMYQEELKRQVEMEIAKRTEQNEVMCHQSRLAAMGEMIDSIAHQWRQPLNALGLIVQGLRHISKEERLDRESLLEIENEIMQKINYMSQTIDDFSGFFRISKTKETFDIVHSIEGALRLIDVQLRSNNINVKIILEDGYLREVVGFPNEFKQVVMNIVHNAMTAIVKTSQKQGKIEITVRTHRNRSHISIADNGGGIKEENLDKIFDPYFTTRENGSGIGLYMSKVIIEHHMQGRLRVKNQDDGTQFCIGLRCKGLN